MGGDCIDFPCGCSINEHSVLAMCVVHVVEMNQKRADRRREQAEYERMMLEGIMKSVRGERG